MTPASNSGTSAASVALKGIAAGESIVNVYWTDHLGHRGPVEWTRSTASRPSPIEFSASVPVVPGANLITVIAVDEHNRAGSARLSVYSEAAPRPPVSEVRAGWWHGMPVTYAVINGKAIAEGDIILGTADELAASRPPNEPLGLEFKPRGFAIGYVSQLWTAVDGAYQIPYTIETGTPILDSVISYVNTTLTGVIQLVPQTTQANYVTFNFDPTQTNGYCEATEGMAGGQQFIGGAINCSFTGICHEIGHAIGLLHEHQRPDRNAWVVLNTANADKPYLLGDFDFFADDFQLIGLYDYASVMHYPPFSFTKNNLPVLESIPAGIPLSNTTGYSAGDVDAIKRLYGFAPSEVTVVTNPPGLQIIVDGTTYTSPKTFSWPLKSKHTLNLPADPQLENPADGADYEFANWNDGGARSHTIVVVGGSGLLTAPTAEPATTVYEANYVQLWPFSITASPAGSATVKINPAPQSIFSGSFFVDRQQITASATPNTGYNFYGWNDQYPQGADPFPFLIQSPESPLEAILTTFPVTNIGETITGPNTWNPPMFATVDTDTYVALPQRYSQDQSGSAWAPGTTHSIGVVSPEAPVTTNVNYNWNSWTNNGAQSQTITAASTGVKNISASFTPSYVSYTYAENACGTVSYSLSCPNNYCSFPDGTPITMTATPTAGNGMVFAGWTGDLTGTTNPQTTTIHDEFLPVANFNNVATIINATSVAPSQPVMTPNASTLTVTGTGFVNGTFYAYWNGGYRATSGVTSTQATVQLNAGDLSAAGAQSLQVSNFTPGCGSYAFTQVLVKETYGTPQLSITKTHTGSFTQGQTDATYTVTVTNAANSTGPTSGTVTVTDTIPSGLTLVSMAGTGWTCTANSCTRSDSLNTGKSYPAITVTVDVAANAPSEVTNTVTVSGGRSASAGASNPTTIN